MVGSQGSSCAGVSLSQVFPVEFITMQYINSRKIPITPLYLSKRQLQTRRRRLIVSTLMLYNNFRKRCYSAEHTSYYLLGNVTLPIHSLKWAS